MIVHSALSPCGDCGPDTPCPDCRALHLEDLQAQAEDAAYDAEREGAHR